MASSAVARGESVEEFEQQVVATGDQGDVTTGTGNWAEPDRPHRDPGRRW